MKINMNKKDFLYIAGLIQSDVSIREHKGEIYLEIKSSRIDMLNLFKKVLRKYVDNFYEKYYKKGHQVKIPSIKIYARITKNNFYFKDFQKLLEIKKDYTKIKNFISSQEDALWFFLGLFDGDGSYEIKPDLYIRIRITQRRRDFLEFVKEILLRFGIACSVCKDGYSRDGKEKYAINILTTSVKEVSEFIADNSKHTERKVRALIGLEIMKLKKVDINKARELRKRLYDWIKFYKEKIRIYSKKGSITLKDFL